MKYLLTKTQKDSILTIAFIKLLNQIKIIGKIKLYIDVFLSREAEGQAR